MFYFFLHYKYLQESHAPFLLLPYIAAAIFLFVLYASLFLTLLFRPCHGEGANKEVKERLSRSLARQTGPAEGIP